MGKTRALLKKFGWMSLDPWYEESDEWLNAVMTVNDEIILDSIKQFLIPANKYWSDVFFK